MKIALFLPMEDAASARFAQQLGLEYVVSALAGRDGVIDYESLARGKEFFAGYGLDWQVIENLPPLHIQNVMFGRPGRDEEIDNVCQTVRNMGKAGIGVLQYQWMLLGGLRTETSPTGRGGSRYSRYDHAVALQHPAAAMEWYSDGVYPRIPDREMSEDEVWGNLLYFLQRVVPVAEQSGVKLAVHPDDAPVPEFMGVARINTSLEGLQRVIDGVPSSNNGIGFCQGTIATMAGVDMIDAIHRIGSQNKIFFAHFRNPRGEVPYFDETFPDEGDSDMLAAVRAYREVGFSGVIRIDHCPSVIGDNRSADRSFAFQVGYLKGLVQAVEAVDGPWPTGRGC